MEEIIVDPKTAKVRNPSFTDYLIPTILDTPTIPVDVLELADDHAPYGLRGVGEAPTLSVHPGRPRGDPGRDGSGAHQDPGPPGTPHGYRVAAPLVGGCGPGTKSTAPDFGARGLPTSPGRTPAGRGTLDPSRERPEMLDIADELHRWVAQGRDFAVATVVAVGGSAPRQPGAALAVDADGTAIGSVSGGCVEGAVYELCRQALAGRRSRSSERFGYSDEDAFAVGLTCGGVIDILVTPVRRRRRRAVLASALAAAAARERRRRSPGSSAGPAELLGRALLVRARRLVRGRPRRPPRAGPHGGGRGPRPARRGPHRHPGDRRGRLPLRSAAHAAGRVVACRRPA